jgi:hypothetical protein
LNCIIRASDFGNKTGRSLIVYKVLATNDRTGRSVHVVGEELSW